MITVEKIEISETTTSFRVEFGEVDFKETLDQRYRRHCMAMGETAPNLNWNPTDVFPAIQVDSK